MRAVRRDRKSPSVLPQSRLVKFRFFLCGCSGPEEGPEGADEGEVDLGGEIPERLEVLRSKAVNKIHGGNESCFGGVADHEEAVCVMVGGKRLDNPAVERDLGGEVGKVEISYSV